MISEIFPIPILWLLACLLISPIFKILKKEKEFKAVLLSFIIFSLVSLFFSYSGAFFEITALNRAFSLLFLGILFLIILYSPSEWESSALQNIVALALLGIALVKDFFSFYILLELALISSTFLIYNKKGKKDSIRAAKKYLLMNIFGTVLILFGIAGTYSLTQSFNPVSTLPKFILLLIAVGLILKSAIFPFHSWLVDAHSTAPAQTCGLLSGLLVTLGFVGIIKFLPYSRLSSLFFTLALISMFYAGLAAIREWHLKRLLAYSSIIHMSYILFGLGLFTQLGTFSSVMHIFNHALAKVLLFLAAGLIISKGIDCNIRELSNFGRSKIGFLFLLGLLSSMAIPPLNSFVSELLLVVSGLEAKQFLGVGLFLFSYLVALTFYLRILYFMFLQKSKNKFDIAVSWYQLVPLIILAILVVLLGVYPKPLFYIVEAAMKFVPF